MITEILLSILTTVIAFIIYAVMCMIIIYLSAVLIFKERTPKEKTGEEKDLMDKFNNVNSKKD